MKKRFCIFLVFCINFFYISPLFAISSDGLWDIEITRKMEYVVDTWSSETLQELQEKITKLLERTNQSEETLNILQYFSFIINQELERRIQWSPKMELSLEEKESVKTEILTLQKEIQTNIEAHNEAFFSRIASGEKYSEKWNFSTNIKLDLWEDSKAAAAINLKQYSAHIDGLNQELSGRLSGFIDAHFMGENIKAEWESLIDFILKDENIYLLFQELSIKRDDPENNFGESFDVFLKKINELGNSQTYIKIPGGNGEVALQNLIKKESLGTITEEIFSEPLFEIAGKKSESYILIPSKHFCDSFKKLGESFDPLWGDDCSDWQYDGLIEKFQDRTQEILYTPGSRKNILYRNNSEDRKGNVSLSWGNNKDFEIQAQMIDSKNAENHINFTYNTLGFEAQVFQDDLSLTWAGNFDTNGHLEKMSFDLQSSDVTLNMHIIDDTMALKMRARWDSQNMSCTLGGDIKTPMVALQGSCSVHDERMTALFEGEEDYTIDLGIKLESDTKLQKISLDISAHRKNTLPFFSWTLEGDAQRSDLEKAITEPRDSIEFESVFPETPQGNFLY